VRASPVLIAASLLLCSATGSAASAEASVELPLFSPPIDTPLIVERTVWRDLGDAELKHTHQFRVVFHQRPRGYEMVMQLLSAKLSGPDKIKYLLDMQLANENYEPMSFLLSSDGVIQAGDTNEKEMAAVREGLKVALEKVRDSRSPRDAARAVAFMQQLENATREARPDWPRAFFVPQYDDYAHEGTITTTVARDGFINWHHSRTSMADGATIKQDESCDFDPLGGYVVRCHQDTLVSVGDYVQKGWTAYSVTREPAQKLTSSD
jgi:hypothetical protein